jgi:hypothetical protein
MSLVIYPKISLVKLSHHDLSVISNACSKYSEDLQVLKEKENRSQQHIHTSILQVFRFELLKKITTRGCKDKPSKINMEVFTAFVLFDALQHYSNNCDSVLDQAIIRRISFVLHRELPTTSDKTLSIMSELNFN